MIVTKLSSALVSPSKVANLLDWRKSIGVVMGLDITRERIGIAVSEHPEHFSEPLALNSILLQDRDSSPNRSKGIAKESLLELEAAVRKHHVCAFVVNWPLNEGRMGEQCGKVLQVLDSVMDQSNSVVTRKRPFTLWAKCAATSSSDSVSTDEWGRSPVFARAPVYFEDMKYSSKSVFREESSTDPSLVAADILDDYIKTNWILDRKMGKATTPKKNKTDYFFSTHSVDEYNCEKACLQAALL